VFSQRRRCEPGAILLRSPPARLLPHPIESGTTALATSKEHSMDTYLILRRNLCAPADLPEVDRRSQAELDARPDTVRKLRSYVFEEADGTLGTICIYDAVSEDAIRDHGTCADVPVSEVARATAVDVHRPDPERLTI
jgi:hypothetical protein